MGRYRATRDRLDSRRDSDRLVSFPLPPERPFRSVGANIATAQADLGGFRVAVVDAQASGLQVVVKLSVSGREDAGENLTFVGAPALVWPDGNQTRLSGGHTEGRMMAVNFDRPAGVQLSPGDRLRMIVHGFAGQDESAPPTEKQMSGQPVALLVALSNARNPVVHELASKASVGPGSLSVDRILEDNGTVRIEGHMDGFTNDERAALAIGEAKLVKGNGLTVDSHTFRFGTGSDSSRFSFDFPGSIAEAVDLELALSAKAQNGVLHPGRLGNLVETPTRVRLSAHR